MADKAIQKVATDGSIVPMLVHDNGDGTFSYGMSATGAAAGPALGAYTERSTTITLGGTAQVGMAALATRKAWVLQNIGSADLWISFVETAQADNPGSMRIAPGASAFSSGGFVSTQALSIIGATTGQKFTLWEA
jgi:hypothetical protein